MFKYSCGPVWALPCYVHPHVLNLHADGAVMPPNRPASCWLAQAGHTQLATFKSAIKAVPLGLRSVQDKSAKELHAFSPYGRW